MPNKFVIVQSKDRVSSLSASTTDFVIILPKAYNDVAEVELVSATIPNTFYNIRTGVNDRMVWFRGATSYNFIIPPGAYSMTDLLSVIQTGMNAADANTYVLSYSTTTFKCTIAGAGAFILNWATNPQAATSCYLELGWAAADTSSATSQISTNAADLAAVDYIYVSVPELGVNIETTVANLRDVDAFCIPVNDDSGQLIHFDTNSHFTQVIKRYSGNPISQFTIKLKDRNNTLLNLNGSEWSMILRLNINS